MPFTRLQAMLIGILFTISGIVLLVGDVLLPGFLWGASLGGIGAVLAPFGLIFLGVLMILGSLFDTKGKQAHGD